MAPLMTSNVLSTGPLEVGGAEDDGGGLNAGVAPGNDMTEHRRIHDSINIHQLISPNFVQSALLYRAPPSFQPDSQEPRPRKSLAAVGDLASSHRAR